MLYRTIKKIHSGSNLDGLIPGIKGQRAFPTRALKNTDPFLMLDHIGPQKVGKDYFLDGKGHDHPHRGFETLTFMFEGRMEHRDSLNSKATLESGSVQRMNAGSGIIHGGDMAADVHTGRFHEVQLWINNPMVEKMSSPDIQNVDGNEFPIIESENISVRIITGVLNGQKGIIGTKATTQIAHLIAKGRGEIVLNGFVDGHQLMVYVLEGQAKISDKELSAFQLAELSGNGDALLIQTTYECQLLVMAGQALNEPVVFGGPFVMNTEAEIQQAQLDFQNGKFGTIN